MIRNLATLIWVFASIAFAADPPPRLTIGGTLSVGGSWSTDAIDLGPPPPPPEPPVEETNEVPSTLNASVFGFNPANANNLSAMLAMQSASQASNRLAVTFDPGTYVITLGSEYAACDLWGLPYVYVYGPGATLHCTTRNTERAIFRLIGCSNITMNIGLSGLHTGTSWDAVKGVFLWASNQVGNLTLTGNRLWDLVRIGNFEDPFPEAPAPPLTKSLYAGNRDFVFNLNSTNCHYSIAAYLCNNLTITSKQIGTAVANFSSHRAVYIAGSTNVYAVSTFRDCHVPDGVNIIGSAPGWAAPQHFGCDNVTIVGTDLGSTYWVQYQSMGKFNIVTSSRTNVTTYHRNCTFDLHGTASSSQWWASGFVRLASLGASAAHRFENLKVKGDWTRSDITTGHAISVEVNQVGLSYVHLTLEGVTDTKPGGMGTVYSVVTESALPYDFNCYAKGCSLQSVSLSNPTYHHFTDLGP